MIAGSEEPAFARWRAWGTLVEVGVPRRASVRRAVAVVGREMEAFDRACSRFRPDSDLSRVNRAGGLPTLVSPLFAEALEHALIAAARTDGAVDPTVGGALVALGYDRDFDELVASPPSPSPLVPPGRVPGWRTVSLDRAHRVVQLPPTVRLDLGATAKAWCADRAAAKVAERTGGSALVAIGGDVASAGPAPDGGWRVAVIENARDDRDPRPLVVSVASGALATSGTTARRWDRAGHTLHHVIDPATGWSATPVWRYLTVAAHTCLTANTAATAAVVQGEDAPFHLAQLGLPARLVARDGSVVTVAGWPDHDQPAAPYHELAGRW